MTTSPDRNSTLKTAGLGAALAFLATEAVAAVQYTDNADATYSCGGGPMTASFNPITGATSVTGDYNPQQPIALRNTPSCCGSSITFYFGSNPGTITTVSFLSTPVTAGTVIDADSLGWANSSGTGYVANANFSGYSINDHALVAYRFKATDGPTADTYLYGWAEFSTGNSGPVSIGLYSYAYEDSGVGIVAGATSAIPEPGVTAALFGLAAFALIGFRRIRQRTGRA